MAVSDALSGLVRPPIPMPRPDVSPLLLGATWNPELARRVGAAFGDRHAGEVVGVQLDQALRDPRLGRNELGYAEDPLLAARLAAAHLFGMSGACAPVITDFDAQACCGRRYGFTARALHEQDLPVYRAVFETGGARGLVLPGELFDQTPMVVRLLVEEGVRPWSGGRAPVFHAGDGSAVAAMKSGADGFVGADQVLDELVAATAEGRLGEPEILAAAARVAALFGHVGVPSGEDHEGLALAVAREAVVLLRNDGLLPLLVGPGMRFAVVHPGRSCGLPAAVQRTVTAAGGTVTVAAGNDRVRLREADGRRCLVAVGDELRLGVPTGDDAVFEAIEWSRHLFELNNGRCRQLVEIVPAQDGTVLLRNVHNGQTVEDGRFVWELVADGAANAAEAAAAADVALVVVGNDGVSTDRENLLLPAQQERTLRAVRAANPNTVLAVLSSHPYALDWAEAYVGGMLWSAPGPATDVAVAEVLFGERSPAGRLPQTWYRATDTAFDTYLHHRAEPLFPFGHGLSYTTFRHDPPSLSDSLLATDNRITVSTKVHNTGYRDADEVVQLYTRQLTSRVRQPVRQLRHFTRIAVPARSSRTVTFTLTADDVSFFDVTRQDWVLETAGHEVLIGGHSARFDAVGVELPIRRLAGASLLCTRADEASGMVLVDGPAMEATAQRSWLAFRGCDPAGCRTWSLEAANPGRVPLYVGLHLDDPKGPLIGVLAVPPGPFGPHTASITGEAPGIRDVFAVFTQPGMRAGRLTFGS